MGWPMPLQHGERPMAPVIRLNYALRQGLLFKEGLCGIHLSFI